MASSDYDGGTGGKFRKRPFRRAPASPYDRPQVANRRASPSPSPIGGNNRWISKIVDPASRIIGRSASKLFSSVLQKRLSTPPATQPPPSGSVLGVYLLLSWILIKVFEVLGFWYVFVLNWIVGSLEFMLILGILRVQTEGFWKLSAFLVHYVC